MINFFFIYFFYQYRLLSTRNNFLSETIIILLTCITCTIWYLFCISFSYFSRYCDKCFCLRLLWHLLRVVNNLCPKSCNEISRTRQLIERYDYNRLSARTVHVHQTLHVDHTRRLFLVDRPPLRVARSPVRCVELRQLWSVSDKNIQLPGAVRVAADRPVDIRLGEVQDRHLRAVLVHRLVERRKPIRVIVF